MSTKIYDVSLKVTCSAIAYIFNTMPRNTKQKIKIEPVQKQVNELARTVKTVKKLSNSELLDENGKFKKGHPPSGGRPPGTKNLTTAVREALLAIHDGTEKPYQQLLVERIIKLAVEGDTTMIRILWEQLDGRPAQKIIGTLTGVMATTQVSNSKAKKLIAEFNASLRESLNNEDDEEEK